MIYSNNFIDYLKFKLGDPIIVRTDNIVCRCPWCEMNSQKKHYHLWISKQLPIFQCFHSDCGESGHISKLFKVLDGIDNSKKYIEKEIPTRTIKIKKSRSQSLIFPELDINKFNLKDMYIRKRLLFSMDTQTKEIGGLIYDIEKFFSNNNITIDKKYNRLMPFLQSNFVAFSLKHGSIIIFRNIDKSSSFSHFKLNIRQNFSPFMDYYTIGPLNKNSTDIVLAEGIFDILSANIYWKQDFYPRLFAASLSSVSYTSLIKSICFDEQLFSCNVHILSDSNIKPYYYSKLKRDLGHIVKSFKVYYNISGDDFNCLPLNVKRII